MVSGYDPFQGKRLDSSIRRKIYLTKLTLQNMKTRVYLHLITAAAAASIATSCSEKSTAAIDVLKSKAEDALVAQAGEGDVAIALMQKQYAELKERLVRIKALKRTFDRRSVELDARAAELKAENKADLAERQVRMAESYRQKKELLEKKEEDATEELKQFATIYEQQKSEIQMLKEEIEMTKSMGGLDSNLGADSPLGKRMETVKDLTEKLHQKLDRAQALLEIGDLEKDL
jgi:hypothetical protein